jgi:tetratricopeptide (TPR) repeat protein
MSEPSELNTIVGSPDTAAPLGKSWGRLVPGWKTGVAFVFALLLAGSLRDYYNKDLVIESISVSEGLDRAGVSSAALTHAIADELLALVGLSEAASGSPTAPGSVVRTTRIAPVASRETLDIEIPETKLSLKAVTVFLRQFLPIKPVPTLSGDAVLLNGKLVLTLSITSDGDITAKTETFTDDVVNLNHLVERCAEFALSVVDPIAVAIHHYNYDDPAQVGLDVALGIVETQSHALSPERAADALVFWGSLDTDRRMFRDALANFAAAKRLAQSERMVLLGEAAARNAMGDATKAAQLIQLARLYSRSPAALLASGISIRGSSDAKAIAFYREALEKDRHYTPAYLELSRVSQANEDWSGAVSFAKLAIETALRPRQRAVGFVQMGDISNQRGRFQEAIKYYENAKILEGGSVDGYEGMARAKYQLGQNNDADLTFKAAVTETNHVPSVLKDWGDMLQDFGEDFEKAESIYKCAIAADTRNNFDFAHGALGTLYYRLGRPAEAAAEFDIARSISYYQARIETDWGDVLVEIGQFDQARTHYATAIKEDPQMCDAWLGLSRLDYRRALDQGHPNDRERTFEKAFFACPYAARVWSEWGDTIYTGPFPGDSMSPYLRLSHWDPGHLWARVRVTQSVSERKRPLEIRRALQDVHFQPSFLNLLGAELFWNKPPQYDAAAELLSQALLLAPEDTFARSTQIAVSVANGKMERTKLRTLIPGLLDGSVDTPLIDSILKQGWFEEAEIVARNAFRLSPWDAYVNLEYSSALAGSGKINESRWHLRRAAGGYFKQGGSSDDALKVFQALVGAEHADRLDSDFRQACQLELDRIHKFRK